MLRASIPSKSTHFQSMWVSRDIIGLLSVNVVPLSINSVPAHALLSMIVVQPRLLFSVRGSDVFRSLQVPVDELVMHEKQYNELLTTIHGHILECGKPVLLTFTKVV